MPSKSFIVVTAVLLGTGVVAMYLLQPEYPTQSGAPEIASGKHEPVTAEMAKELRLRTINERLDELDRRQQAGEDVYEDRLVAFEEEIEKSDRFGYADHALDLRCLRAVTVAGRPLKLARVRFDSAIEKLAPGLYLKATIRTIDDLTRKLELAKESLAALDALDSAAAEYRERLSAELRKAGASDEQVREQIARFRPEEGAGARRLDREEVELARRQIELLIAHWGHWRFTEGGVVSFDSPEVNEAFRLLRKESLATARRRAQLAADPGESTAGAAGSHTNAGRIYASFSVRTEALRERKRRGEDVHEELIQAHEEAIELVSNANAPTLLRRLKIAMAMEMSRREPELARDEYAAIPAALSRLKFYEPATYESPERVSEIRKVLDQYEVAANRFDAALRDAAANRNKILMEMGYSKEEIAEVSEVHDRFETIRIHRATFDCDRQLIAALRGMVDLVLEADGKCSFLPGQIISFEDPALHKRMAGYAQAMQASAERREKLRASLPPTE